jgi:hypothetical protein
VVFAANCGTGAQILAMREECTRNIPYKLLIRVNAVLKLDMAC